MHPSILNPYLDKPGLLHRLSPEVKLLGAVAFVVTIAVQSATAWRVFACAGALLVFGAVLSRLSFKELLIRLLRVEPFALGTALLALTQKGGLIIFCGLLLKSTLCLLCMILLSTTTRFSEILSVLRRLRVPALLITTLALMHRYLFLLADETVRLSRARKSRTFGKGRVSAWRSSATVIALLFVRASERAERVYDAMCARGWKT